ncbi:respiratory chain complex I subunit 1 family protein [Escherichia coli]
MGDLITLLYLFAIARFFFAISGLDTGSPFTAIGASREAMLACRSTDGARRWSVRAAQGAGSTNISKITDTVYHWPLSQSIPLVPALCACVRHFYRNGQTAVDLAEAEQELQEGPLSEYSGNGFGVMKWGISLKQLVVLDTFVGVFIPWGQNGNLHRRWTAAGAGDCHRKTGGRRPGYRAVRKQHGPSAS